MAVLVLLAAAAGTRVISAYLLVRDERSVRFLLAVSTQIRMLCTHLAHIGASLSGPLRRFVGIPERNESSEQE